MKLNTFATVIIATATLLPLTACGLLGLERTDFPDQLVNEDGETIFSEEVLDIITDPDLDADAQRAALADLGITNDEFIDAIVDAVDVTPPPTDGDNTDGDGSDSGDDNG